MIVTHPDSGLHSIDDLLGPKGKGRSFAFGDKGSTSGYLIPLHLFQQHGIDPEKHFAPGALHQAPGDPDAGDGRPDRRRRRLQPQPRRDDRPGPDHAPSAARSSGSRRRCRTTPSRSAPRWSRTRRSSAPAGVRWPRSARCWRASRTCCRPTTPASSPRDNALLQADSRRRAGHRQAGSEVNRVRAAAAARRGGLQPGRAGFAGLVALYVAAGGAVRDHAGGRGRPVLRPQPLGQPPQDPGRLRAAQLPRRLVRPRAPGVPQRRRHAAAGGEPPRGRGRLPGRRGPRHLGHLPDRDPGLAAGGADWPCRWRCWWRATCAHRGCSRWAPRPCWTWRVRCTRWSSA